MNTQLPIYDFVMANLRARRIPQRRVAVESGVPFSTLTKIAQGQTKHPSVHSIQALADYFQKLGADNTVPQPHQEVRPQRVVTRADRTLPTRRLNSTRRAA